MTAGARFAAAVPDVHVIATGRPLAFAAPSAKKPAQRSSMCEKQRSRAVAHEREDERRAARAGRRARLAHAAARELVDERAQQQVGVGARRA